MTEGIERFVPEEGKAPLMTAEHVARYRLATQLVRQRSVLDAACGAGYGTAMLSAAGARSVTGVDIADVALPPSQPGINFTAGDLRCLPFEDASFECVVCFEAIEHVAEPERVMDELARVLTAGGVLVLSTPNRMVNPPGNPYHVFEYTPAELRAVLASRFSHVATLTQHPFAGSLIDVRTDAARSDAASENVDGLRIDVIGGPTVARLQRLEPDSEQYTIALASNEPLTCLDELQSVVVLGDAVELRSWHEQLDASAAGERAAAARADGAERRVAALEAEMRFVTEHVRQLGARLVAGEQQNADALSTRAFVAQLEEKLTRQRDELAASQAEVAALRSELDPILASTAWRLTRPARQVVTAVRWQRRRNRS